MTEPLTGIVHDGAFPTNHEFAQLLEQWGFRSVRERRIDRYHLSMRGPHGGRIRVLASLQGRADADQILRAARLAHADVETFLAGPPARSGGAAFTESDATSDPAADADARKATVPATRSGESEPTRRTGDTVVSQVLSAHARYDRPMGFEEVVSMCASRVTRAQVREASAHLCRTGQLQRICEGVYQWAHGTRHLVEPSPGRPSPSTESGTPPPIDELFARLFPNGLLMTPQMLRDLQQWTDLTRTLAAEGVRSGA